MKTPKRFIFSIVTILVFLLHLMSPILVQADGETPAAPTETAEVTSTPDPTETAIPVTETSTPIPTDAPGVISTPLPNEATIDPVETVASEVMATVTPMDSATQIVASESSVPTDLTSPTVDPAETVYPDSAMAESPAAEELTLVEVLQEIPIDTSVIVLDENGEALSLVTQEAADAIVTGDPVWCPDGVAPTPLANGCTRSYATMDALITAEGANINSQNINGTIWITSGTVGDAAPISIGGPFFMHQNWANFALTLQGGWSGVSGDTTIGSNSVFAVPIYISDWNNTVTINNITVASNGWVDGLSISGSAVTINNSTFSGSLGDGANISSWGNVTINNSTFSGNLGNGASISGDATIGNSTFSNNGSTGATINSFDTLTVANSTFSGNSGVGLSIDGTITNSYGTPVGMGVATICNNQFQNNGQDENIINTIVFNCTAPTATPTALLGLSSSLINVPSDQVNIEIPLGCSQFSAYIVAWSTGDQIQISCLDGGVARITRVDNTALNPDLPAGYEYVTAYNVEIFQSGVSIPLMPAGGFVQPMLASRHNNPNYGIMVWDAQNNKWTLLNQYQQDQYGASVVFPFDPSDPQDEQKILQGTRMVTNQSPNREQVRTNFPGIFVLVQQ